MNPYLFPDDRHRVINFSGGRSSGYMLAQILEAHGFTVATSAFSIRRRKPHA